MVTGWARALVRRQDRLYRVAKNGGEPWPLPFQPPTVRRVLVRFSRDGRSIYYSVITGPRDNHDFWKLSLGDGKVSRLTKLDGRRGNIGSAFSTDDRYLYFTWREDDGDIWVMDVVNDADLGHADGRLSQVVSSMASDGRRTPSDVALNNSSSSAHALHRWRRPRAVRDFLLRCVKPQRQLEPGILGRWQPVALLVLARRVALDVQRQTALGI